MSVFHLPTVCCLAGTIKGLPSFSRNDSAHAFRWRKSCRASFPTRSEFWLENERSHSLLLMRKDTGASDSVHHNCYWPRILLWTRTPVGIIPQTLWYCISG